MNIVKNEKLNYLQTVKIDSSTFIYINRRLEMFRHSVWHPESMPDELSEIATIF